MSTPPPSAPQPPPLPPPDGTRNGTYHPHQVPPRPRRGHGRLYPERCEVCGHVLPPAVSLKVLTAARVIAALPGGRGTVHDVVAAGVATRSTTASALLRQAARDGLLVATTERARTAVRGRGATVYEAGAQEVQRQGSYAA